MISAVFFPTPYWIPTDMQATKPIKVAYANQQMALLGIGSLTQWIAKTAFVREDVK